MDIVIWVLVGVLVVAIGGMFFCQYMLSRNEQVLLLRMKMFGKIIHCDDWKWRHEMFDSVTYNQMLNRFWVPVKAENFYSDLSFLEPREEVTA